MMVKFVVLTTQRSGSTLLCRALNQVPQIHCMGECFWPGNQADPTFAAFLKHLSLKRSVFDGLPEHKQRIVLGEFLDHAYGQHPGVMAVGSKLHYAHLETFPEILTWMKQHSVCIVHLLRKNHLKRLVSWIIKEKWGRNYSTRPVFNQVLPQAKIKISCHNLVSLLEDMDGLCEQYRQVFAVWKNYREVFYEDFITDREQVATQIGTFLGVDALEFPKPDIRKINSDHLKDIVVNYDEMAETLKPTRFYRYLDGAV